MSKIFKAYLFGILAICAITVLFNQHKKDCCYPSGYPGICHHKDSNTDIYLRRLIDKLDKIFEQIDKTPYKDQQRNKIMQEAERATIIIARTLDQLKLLKHGKLLTGIMALVTPCWLLNYDNRQFDDYSDSIVCYHKELLNYTQEEAEMLRRTLLDRSMPPATIKAVGLDTIRLALYPLIDYERLLIEKPEEFSCELCDWKRYEKDVEMLMKAIESGEITEYDQLESSIRAVEKGEITNYDQLRLFIRRRGNGSSRIVRGGLKI